MRFIEGLILIAVLFSLLVYLLPKYKRPRWLLILPALAVLLILVHLLVEGYRWQMVPAYLLAAILAIGLVWSVLQMTKPQSETPPRGRRILAIIGVILGLMVLALATVIPSISPVFTLPEPTGPHAVGTQYFYWTDENRPDESTSDPRDFREVSVQIWYPAEQSGNKKSIPYMSQEAARASLNSPGIPEFLFDHHDLVRTHAYLGSEVARTGAPFPVITYSNSGLMSSHMTLYEEIASHGYVVISIGHPFWNPFVYGPGGEVLPFDGENEQYQAWWTEAGSPSVVEAKSKITQASTTTTEERAHQRHNELRPVALPDLKMWAEDIGFVLDKLDKANQGTGLLAGALDLERVGVMGFSKGGAAAGQFCVTDERCKAGINLTGFMYGAIVNTNLDRPFLFVDEEELWCPDCSANDLFFTRSESDAYQMKIKGARHASFGDPCLWGKLIELSNEEAAIECERMIYIQNLYTKAFFDKHLKGLESSLLDGPSAEFPELIIKTKRNTS